MRITEFKVPLLIAALFATVSTAQTTGASASMPASQLTESHKANTPLPAASNRNPDLLHRWTARWISHPEDPGDTFGVFHFKKEIELDAKPDTFIIHISADNRYKLYINGTYVTFGPARGDRLNWRYTSLDLAPYLEPGINVLAATVWNFAEHRPVAQHSFRTGLIVQGDGEAERVADSDSTWMVTACRAFSPLPVQLNAYYVVGPGESFDGSAHHWDWQDPGFGLGFVPAREGEVGRPTMSLEKYGGIAGHVLMPRTIPLMEESPQEFQGVRRSNPAGLVEDNYNGTQVLTLPPNTTATFLLDQGHLTTAYPVVQYSGGKGSQISLTFAESLFHADGSKGNRNQVQGKSIVGNTDVILPDGGSGRVHEPLWWRTFRYVEVQITTRAEPLAIHRIHSRFTGYPFEEQAEFRVDANFEADAGFQSQNGFRADAKLLGEIWEVGWRTQRLCAGENYFDCPYYEQLQYAGDTRIQCLVSAYVSGDTRLFKNALLSYRDSKMPFGLTQSRYPSYDPQLIPTFSLVWIAMIHDYWMLTPDTETVRDLVPGMLSVLDWYEDHLEPNGMLGKLEWWNFVDWVVRDGWDAGVPPGARDGQSAVISLYYVYALRKGAELLEAFGYPQQARRYQTLADRVGDAVREQCWDAGRGLFADTPDKNYYSQHANVLAVLGGLVPKGGEEKLMERVLELEDMAPASYYFTFYVIEALQAAGMGDRYLETLAPWKTMLDNGLTTFAEEPEPTRSDCHAWSASPLYYFLSLVCGLQPAGPGFETVEFRPHLGPLPGVQGTIPHPAGKISVRFQKTDSGGLGGMIDLPAGVSGLLHWKGKEVSLRPGANEVQL
ncbi:alpha-L-rhamnosidase-related protein [Robiginitalea biformata]|uniref:Alpha-L-rhamnosidase (Putative) n=1 Tax=Robiginitalea biformata (strain ATCC BAA-864 / DSM 15991 / KCTC 12146 / HTCC2501) TaxID=313596 RepID=A4CNW3_ROBBH|nr:family 78 glycoside hydrolase catalytic domain [Robiginitalea biformata]EAR14580.1 alpha-L-rhamnosidase (putative) [Robiginitalea biformata HTCC2501]